MLSLPASSHHHIIIDPFDNTAPIILLILLTMSYVKQICGGYNEQSLLGNWLEERLYPSQPFREQQQKQVLTQTFRQETRMKVSHALIKLGSSVL